MWIFKILAAELPKLHHVNHLKICCIQFTADHKAIDYSSRLAKIISNASLNKFTMPVQQMLTGIKHLGVRFLEKTQKNSRCKQDRIKRF